MRTPNCFCIICGKPLYRRPYELEKVRYVSCLEHRAQAARQFGLTEEQLRWLEHGRFKGKVARVGYKHKEESKQKASEAHKRWCEENKDRVIERGLKIRGDLHYKWKGGVSRLNVSIRQMNESRKWAEAVKQRDGGRCCACGTHDAIEAHHIIPLSEILSALGISNREDARANSEVVWDINNGKTLCRTCHCLEHERMFDEDQCKNIQPTPGESEDAFSACAEC